jgi:hypothetical protein
MPSKAFAMARARDAARPSLLRRAHIRKDAGVLSRLIANAMALNPPSKQGGANQRLIASGKKKCESEIRLGGINSITPEKSAFARSAPPASPAR